MTRPQRTVLTLMAIVLVGGTAAAEWVYDELSYEFVGTNAPSAGMETAFGPRIRTLDAKAYGFNFGGPLDQFRNLNVISEVYQADREITIGTGQMGTPIVLEPGDLTFAYTLDYTGTMPGVTESTIKDFQLWRLVYDSGIFYEEGVSNPGPHIALYNIDGGAYNTATPEFNGEALQAYPNGFTGILDDEPGVYQASYAEFGYPPDHQVQPHTKAMVLLFAHDVKWMRIGAADGSTLEGGNVIGAAQIKDFPVLIPVVPEPAGLLMLTLGSAWLCRRRPFGR